MTLKKRLRQAPTVLVECDLVLTDPESGEPWLDRRGQWVRYRSRIKYGVLKKMAALAGSGANTVEVDPLLHHVIASWDWDDDFGDPMPSPDTPGVFDVLEAEEVSWLIEHVPGVGEAPKSS